MNQTTTVHVLRHGEVDNPTGVLYGRMPDFHLTALGRRMAARAAEHFAERPLALLVSSPMERAQETIAPIASLHPELKVHLDDDVTEAANAFEGQSFGPGHHPLRDPHNWKLLVNPVRPSWGEPYVDIAERMTRAILHAAEKVGPAGEALIVSHQLPIVMVQRTALGKRLAHAPWDRECDLASVTSLVFQDDQLIDIFYSSPAQDI